MHLEMSDISVQLRYWKLLTTHHSNRCKKKKKKRYTQLFSFISLSQRKIFPRNLCNWKITLKLLQQSRKVSLIRIKIRFHGLFLVWQFLRRFTFVNLRWTLVTFYLSRLLPHLYIVPSMIIRSRHLYYPRISSITSSEKEKKRKSFIYYVCKIKRELNF